MQTFSIMATRTSSGWGFPTNDLILLARQKLSRDRIDQVALLAGLTKKEMAQILGVTERNLYNQHPGSLSVPLSERLLILEKLFEHGLAVFDGQQIPFQDWLRTPLAELATPEVGFPGPTAAYTPIPIDQMGTKQGPVSLSAAASTRRQRAAQAPKESGRSFPTPLSLLDTITGCKLVDNVFIRIEAGVFS
ncbi:hypothetical protein [Fibrisoma limi]|nr:hypothetical protein [Fibrisoma limi]